MSEKAYELLSQSNTDPAKQPAQLPEQNGGDDNERKKRLAGSLIKFGSLAVFAFIVWLFATIAWFSQNKATSSSGMGVKVGTDRFAITMLDSGTNGIFYDPYHQDVHDDNAMVWKMTASNNLINYNPYVDEENVGDLGIKPGSEGVISFNVIPQTGNIDLSFDFEVVGYQASTDENNNNALVMTPLSELEGDTGTTLQDLLNGHILLFEHKTEITESGAARTIYSDPILSDENMHRIMTRSFSEATQVDIYWVWPNTLSTLVNATSFPGITTEPFCSGTSYTAITGNIGSYPQYYLKGEDPSDNIDASRIAQHYDFYGDKYDRGDNEIGMCVNYLLIKLSVTESFAGGGEP